MRVKYWKLYCRETKYKSLLERVTDTIVLWSSIGLFWLSFFGMTGETFPDFVPKRVGTYLGVVIWLLLLWFFYEVLIPRAKSGKMGLQIAIPGLNMILFLAIWLLNKVRISEGLLSIASTYLKAYNSYYNASYSIGDGNPLHASYAFLWAACIWWFLLWNLAYGLRRRWILIAFPIIVPSLQLSVGFSPMGMGVYFLFVGALLMVALGTGERGLGVPLRGKSKKIMFQMQRLLFKGVVVLLIVVSLLLSSVFYKDEMGQLVTRKPEVLRLQDDLLDALSSINFGKIAAVALSREELNNNTPIYTGRSVLTVTLDKRPSIDMYLKGYQGTVYRDSVWIGDYSYFTQASRKNDSKQEEASKALLQSMYNQMPDYDYFSSSLPANTKGMRFSIRYHQNTNIAYVPYYTDYLSLDQEYPLKGDVLVQKNYTDKMIDGVCLNPNYMFRVYIQQQLWATNNGFTLEDYNWYNNVVYTNNLEVPEELEEFFDSYNIKTNVPKELNNPIFTAGNVRDYLDSIMLYSLELEELPAGKDPIIYAMSESGEGYCMHFASAGTMILRYLGIPARYVSGYIAPANSFNLASGKYVSQVKDWNSHAWVEIYIENLGWIPVEMTPGYDGTEDRLPTEPDTDNTESENTETESELDSETESETETETESESMETETDTDTMAGSEDSKNSEDDTTGTDTDTPKGGQWDRLFAWMSLKRILMLLLVVGLVGGLFVAFRRWKTHDHLVLQRAIEKKKTRRAIRYMHRRIYIYLRIRKGMKGANLRDEEMEDLLIQIFAQISEEDWKRYMEIAKKMQYSKEELTEEEMMHCYRCYQAVNHNQIS